MRKLTTAVAALAISLASASVLADDNSMSQWTGDSYKAFAAERTRHAAVAVGESAKLNATPDNGMSRWNGDSYVAFEHARTSPAAVTFTVAESNRARASVSRDVPARTATRGRTSVSPFRNDTAA